jgi:nitrite reductase/ring-hydroxylating ferredoxin subunit
LIEIGPLEELPPGTSRIVAVGEREIGSRFDIRTGRPLTLPAVVPVETFPVVVDGGIVKLDAS